MRSKTEEGTQKPALIPWPWESGAVGRHYRKNCLQRQHDREEPSRRHDGGTDEPWPSARVWAGSGPDAETEPEPVQRRRESLSDYLEDDESHGIAPFESETDKVLVSILGRYDLS